LLSSCVRNILYQKLLKSHTPLQATVDKFGDPFFETQFSNNITPDNTTTSSNATSSTIPAAAAAVAAAAAAATTTTTTTTTSLQLLQQT